MPFPPKKRRRPYLERQAKRHRLAAPPDTPPPTRPSSPTLSTISQTLSPPPSPPRKSPLLTLPDDVFARIISLLQHGPHHRGNVFTAARHAFPLAQVCKPLLSRYSATLRVIDAASTTARDPAPPLLLREFHPPHLRSLVAVAASHLHTLTLPRYHHSLIGAEAVLPMVRRCHNLRHLAFVDCGRVDRRLAHAIFMPSLKVVNVETPSAMLVNALVKSTASLETVALSCVPFDAIPHVRDLLRHRGGQLTSVQLQFDRRSVNLVEDSDTKGVTDALEGLRAFLEGVFSTWVDCLPALQQFQVTASDERELQFAKDASCVILGRALGNVTKLVNELRERPGPTPPGLRSISVCERSLRCVPRLWKGGEIAVRLPGYDVRYRGRGKGPVKPLMNQLQLSVFMRTLEITDLWRLTGGMESLNIGDARMLRLFDEMKDDIAAMIANARDLRRVVSRLPMTEAPQAGKVMGYITVILRAAPWVRELELSHEFVLYQDQPEFVELMRAMFQLDVLHLNAPAEHLGNCNKSRMAGFVRQLPHVLGLLADGSKSLNTFYCERLGEAKIFNNGRTREELAAKIKELEFIIGEKMRNTDCTSLKALLSSWVKQIKHT